MVFYICAAVFLFGAIFNVIFGSGELQKGGVDETDDLTNGNVVKLDDINEKERMELMYTDTVA